ncbi:IclR family transcriptional regulator [Nocardioides sp. LHD-245]|uniref:IclR family transcriptional regulator n=1 Tax=Nocardioides sp. LHD-245 TaxID=3051387 RepID=UPI0027E0B6AD|nr:IclR family transcriptional regulator [Nocardioides sp. LHD-245]
MQRAPGVVEKAAALLRALSATESGATTTELATSTGQPRATTHRLLESLATEGLADRDPTTGRWYLGPETYVLGVAAAARYDLTNEARASVHRLAKETGESAFFSVRRGDEVVVLLREDGDFPVRSYVLYESARFPLAVVSAGLAILAHLPARDVDAFFTRSDPTAEWGPQHAETRVRKRLAATRRTGWSLNAGHVVEGSWGMAAAVFDKAGRPEWALTLTGVEQRFRADRQPALGRLLLEEAHRLSRLA